MMPIRSAIVCFIVLNSLPNPSLAQALPSLPEPDKDPFVGSWKANADNSRPKLNKAEASYVATISRDGDDLVHSYRINKEAPAPLIKRKTYSGFYEGHYRIRCDGLPHSMQCGEAPCSKSCTYKTANRIEGETSGPDGKTSYWTREVSTDAQEMILSEYKDKTRTKLKRVVVRDRVK
jgi:hypothetical protein